jgi:hypothetical protein
VQPVDAVAGVQFDGGGGGGGGGNGGVADWFATHALDDEDAAEAVVTTTSTTTSPLPTSFPSDGGDATPRQLRGSGIATSTSFSSSSSSVFPPLPLAPPPVAAPLAEIGNVEAAVVGLYKLNAVDSEIESAWFQPLNL